LPEQTAGKSPPGATLGQIESGQALNLGRESSRLPVSHTHNTRSRQAPCAFLHGSNFPTRFPGSTHHRFGQQIVGSYSSDLPRFRSLVPTSSARFSGSHLRWQLLRTFSGRLQLIRISLRLYPLQVSEAKDSKNALLLASNLQHLPKHHRITCSAQRPRRATVRRLSYPSTPRFRRCQHRQVSP
jgi:hypothetical protein